MIVNRTGADGTIGLALGERIKVVMPVMVTLLRMHTRGQIVRNVLGVRSENARNGSEGQHSFSWTINQ